MGHYRPFQEMQSGQSTVNGVRQQLRKERDPKEYVIDRLIDCRADGRCTLYRVQQYGYGPSSDTQEPENHPPDNQLCATYSKCARRDGKQALKKLQPNSESPKSKGTRAGTEPKRVT